MQTLGKKTKNYPGGRGRQRLFGSEGAVALRAEEELRLTYWRRRGACSRSFSYSRYWTGTSLQVRLMWRVFSNANDIN